MQCVNYDWAALAKAFRDARNDLRLTQPQLAKRAAVGLGTIKNLEGRRAYTQWPTTIADVEKALEKPVGWARAIAEGRASAEEVVSSTQPPSSLPVGVRRALAEGETLGADVIDLSRPGSSFRLIVVAQIGVYDTDDKINDLREEMEEWMRIQRGVRDLTQRPGSAADQTPDE
jgi:transcriptional regulator with XRE-family HTH domain